MAMGAEQALGLVDFTLYPHLGHPDMPDTTLANIEQWASGIPVPTYAIDDETAIKVVDGTVEVVSEGKWKLLNPWPPARAREPSQRLQGAVGGDGGAVGERATLRAGQSV